MLFDGRTATEAAQAQAVSYPAAPLAQAAWLAQPKINHCILEAMSCATRCRDTKHRKDFHQLQTLETRCSCIVRVGICKVWAS